MQSAIQTTYTHAYFLSHRLQMNYMKEKKAVESFHLCTHRVTHKRKQLLYMGDSFALLLQIQNNENQFENRRILTTGYQQVWKFSFLPTRVGYTHYDTTG